jgi:hypothetical protein
MPKYDRSDERNKSSDNHKPVERQVKRVQLLQMRDPPLPGMEFGVLLWTLFTHPR